MTKPTDAVAGMPSSSFSQAPTASSAAMAAGDMTALNAFWSQPDVRMSAAVAASREPPMTNPKYRGPAVATSPPSAALTRLSITSLGGVGPSGRGPANALRAPSRSSAEITGRVGSEAR